MWLHDSPADASRNESYCDSEQRKRLNTDQAFVTRSEEDGLAIPQASALHLSRSNLD